MEDDHLVWPPLPPGARHRRSPPPDGEQGAAPPEEPAGRRRRGHPLDLEPGETVELDEPWNPRIRRTTPRTAQPRSGRTPYPDATTIPRATSRDVDADVDGQDGWGTLGDADRDNPWDADAGGLKSGGSPLPPADEDPDAEFWGESPSYPEAESLRSPFPPIPSPVSRESSTDALPPSARLYGTPAAPGARTAATGVPRRWAFALAVLLTGAALVAAAINLAPRLVAPQPGPEAGTGRLSDGLAGVAATLPEGWYVAPVPPVSGFTSVARDGAGSLVMARPLPEPAADAKKATAEAAELYSRLLLKGDRVKVVEDRQIPGGHTRAMRAEYRDVVNRPAYLRVTLLTRGERSVLLLGLLQPEQTARRQALDTVLTSLR
ncbi:hypothetical protein [Nonomuraea wenchangensis]|uniref:hypothetical protein n=1 Tax=Nonomuraea wenchangensis TaxID=568860 RepID=UPI0033247B55